jgi:hypothetical protein
MGNRECGCCFLLILASFLVGVYDMQQTQHSLRATFPLVGRGRWLMEALRPFVRQYLLESDTDGAPINRMFRAIVYQRAKGDLASVPFGTKLDTYAEGYEWMGHSIAARNLQELDPDPRVQIGGASLYAALLCLPAEYLGHELWRAEQQCGARAQPRRSLGGFYHNTGEGGVSDFHLEHGGDLVWQVGTGYFGCRSEDGGFLSRAVPGNRRPGSDQDGRDKTVPGRQARAWRHFAGQQEHGDHRAYTPGTRGY